MPSTLCIVTGGNPNASYYSDTATPPRKQLPPGTDMSKVMDAMARSQMSQVNGQIFETIKLCMYYTVIKQPK